MSDQPTSPACPTLEDLAAFVDGRLEAGEREAMVTHVSECERCYEVYAETLRFQEEEARRSAAWAEPADLDAARTRRPRGFRGGWLVAGAAAAAIVAMLLWTPLLDGIWDRRGAGAGLDVADLGRQLSASDSTVYDAAGWSYARSSGGFSVGLDERERSFRLGVRLVDFEVALQRGDAGQALEVLPELTDLAGSFELTEHIVYSYGHLRDRLEAGEAPESLLDLSGQTAGFLEDAADASYLGLGKWAEAGRLAAGSGDLKFLQGRAIRRAPEQWVGLEIPPSASGALSELGERLADRPEAADLPELEAAFSALVAGAGSR